MTLLSEVLQDEIPGEGRVSPLEFEEIGYAAAEGASDALVDASATHTEVAQRDALGELEARLQDQAEQHARELEELRRRMLEEGREERAKEVAEATLRERQAITRTCQRFARERTRYFAAV